MKKIFFILSLFPALALGQDQNYIKSTTYKQPTTTPVSNPDASVASVQVTYFDGLGRPVQKVSQKQSNTGKDIVSHMEYDAFGRQVKEFLPYVTSSASLNYNSSAGTDVFGFYSSTDSATTGNPNFETTGNPYSEKLLEFSPLNRVFKQAAPGNAWAMGQGKEIKFNYQTNQEDEVKKYTVNAVWNAALALYDVSISENNHYSPNTLYKTVTKNENNNTTEEFKNGQGQIVLKRTYNNDAYDTYYLYDQFGNLTYVLPPLAEGVVTPAILDALCYQYKYDYRNRLVEKKLPGKQWEFIVYDKLDRPVATGPAYSPWGATSETDSGWMIVQYDAFGRVIQTGWKAMTVSAATRKDNQNAVNSESNPFVLVENDILTKNFYDNYTFLGSPVPTSLPDSSYGVATNVKGLATGSWVRVLIIPAETVGETSHIIYDSKFRPVRTYTASYLGGYTQVDTNLDFSGKTRYTITKHKRVTGDVEILTKDNFIYTDQDRLIEQTQDIGTQVQLIARNTYDELGQLISKNVGGVSTASVALQKVDYTYNIRGWLKSINDVNKLSPSLDETDLFAFKINYNDFNSMGYSDSAPTPLFNGNISSTYWKSSSDNALRKYNYSYDSLNRLLEANYIKPNNNVTNTTNLDNYLEKLTYDKNGNIKDLFRNGDRDSDGSIAVNNIDDLVYTYDPQFKNRLLKVFDKSASPQGFNETADNNAGDLDYVNDLDFTSDYAYDLNGNMVRDDNKGITNIIYNHLNLPTKIIMNGQEINYIYNAAGQKLQKTAPEFVGGFVGFTNKTIDYMAGGFQYKDGILLFFPHAEGYVNVSYGDRGIRFFNYVFNYTDHLGNIRLSYGVDPSTGGIKILEENHYYPFGLKHTNYNSDRLMYVKESSTLRIRPMPPAAPLVYQYKYNGQEWQDELGLNVTAMDWRQYDNAIGRFNSIDALAELETQLDISPYAFSWNNPVALSDPSGLCPECPEGKKDGQKYTSTGGVNYIFNNGDWIRETQQLDEIVVEAKKKEKTNNEGQPGKKEGTTGTTLLFGLIQNANVNSDGQSPLEQYRERRDYDGYHPGEGKFDRIFRLMNSSHMEQMSDFGSGGHNMFGGYGRAMKGVSVLGHYPEYVTLAEKINGRTFQIPTSVWNRMSATEQWAANLKFLNRMISRGDRIRLATPLNRVKQGSFYQKELNYLMSKGYRVSSDGLWLTK